MHKYLLLGAIGIVVVFAAFFGIQQYTELKFEQNTNIESVSMSAEDTAIESQPEIQVTNDVKHIIPLDKIRSGGPPKDGIPSIDDPKFVSVQGSDFVSDSDIVIGLEIDGDARAYPLFILVWHEIVNDSVGDTPVSVTYCPLCYTSQVFERVIDGNVVEFGTSGKLYNSNLLMYDRMTESYWSQSLGLAVKGDLTGTQLKTIPFDLITWGDWKKIHPDTLVLSTDTGFIRSYATDPYGSYYTEPRIMFPVEHKDDRLFPKEIIIGLNHDGIYKAYKQNEIQSANVINDKIGDLTILLVSEYEQNARVFERTVDGQVLEFEYTDGKLIDTQTESEWNYNGMAVSGPMKDKQLQRMSIHPGFWFEWVAFHPDTLVYGGA